MKKIIFILVTAIMVLSCTKESSSMYIDKTPKDSTFIHVDCKPMPKAVIPSEIPKD